MCVHSSSGSVEGCGVECTGVEASTHSWVISGCLGAVCFSSETLFMLSGLFPLGLTWGELFGGSGL